MTTNNDHEGEPPITDTGEWREYRHYMVGKMVRQDMAGEDRGYRETMRCLCHLQPAKVIGPSRYELARYMAYCPVTSEQIARGNTMEELWSAVGQSADTTTSVQGSLLP